MKKYDKLRKRVKKETHIEQLITESKLPARAISDEFRTVLFEAKNDRTRKALLRERSMLCSSLQTSVPVSVDRGLTKSDPFEEVFIRAIKS